MLVVLLIGCQQTNPWRTPFRIETYRADFERLRNEYHLDTLDVLTFENYLLQHPVSAEGKTFQQLFIASDTMRRANRLQLVRAFTDDTLLFRKVEHLIPDPNDPQGKDLIYKLFLKNISFPAIQAMSLTYPSWIWRDSVYVDSLAVADSLTLAHNDSIELYRYPIHFDRDAYVVGGTRMTPPLTVDGVSPPDFFVDDFKLIDRAPPHDTEITCSTLEVKILTKEGQPPVFAPFEETVVTISVPCLKDDCAIAATGTGATVTREIVDKKVMYRVTPDDSEFSINVYTICLLNYFAQTPTGRVSLGGRTLLQEVKLKAPEKKQAMR